MKRSRFHNYRKHNMNTNLNTAHMPEYVYEAGHTEDDHGPQIHTSLGLFINRADACKALRYHKRVELNEHLKYFDRSRTCRVRRGPETPPCYEYIKNAEGKYVLHSSNEYVEVTQPRFEGPLSVKGYLRQYRQERFWWVDKRKLN